MAEEPEPETSISYAECTIDNVTGWEVTGYTGMPIEIIIPDKIEGKPVLYIGENAFANCTTLEKLSLPEGLKSIGTGAFIRCTSLGDLSFPASLTPIGEEAFFGCSAIRKISFAANSQPFTLDQQAFAYCTTLEEVFFPEGCKPTIIGISCFWYCSSLSTIELPETITELGDAAFSGYASLDGTIVIPEGVTMIDRNLFYGCPLLDRVVMHDKITSIGSGAFCGCESLTGSFAIPDGQLQIGSRTFSSCKNITSVSIPDSVIAIDNLAFENCTGLTEMTLPAGLLSLGLTAFDGCENIEAYRFKGTRMPADILSIPEGSAAEHMQRFNWPMNSALDLGMTTFGYSFKGIEDMLRDDAQANPEDYPGGYEKYYSWTSSNTAVATVKDGMVTPKKAGEVNIIFVYEFRQFTFKLKFIEKTNKLLLPASLNIIHKEAFTGTDAQHVVIPSGCTSIGSDAFRDMENLMLVSVPDSVTTIEDGAFAGCPNLILVCQSENTAAAYAKTHGITWMIG